VCRSYLTIRSKVAEMQHVKDQNAVLCCAVLCCAVLCCAVLCCAVLCCAVLCCAVPCCAFDSIWVRMGILLLSQKQGGKG